MALDIDTVFRDNVIKGDIHSGAHEPDKAEIRQGLKEWFGASGNPSIVKQTQAALDAVTPISENYGGLVLNDPDPTKNGYYYRDSAAWVKGRGFRDTFAQITLGGAANAQTGAVVAGVSSADVLVYFATVSTDNTGPMTLSISGETPRDVVNAAGNALSAGEWTGTVLLFLNGDGDYQLLIDAGAAAAAAQSASDAAAALAAFLTHFLGNFADDTAAATAAGSPTEGQFYWNTTSKIFRYFDGSVWQAFPYATVAAGGIDELKLSSALANVLTAAVADKAALKAIDTARYKSAELYGGLGLAGHFDWVGTDLSGTMVNRTVTSTLVDDATEVVTSVAHELATGNAVVVTTAVNGLSTNTKYFVIRIDADTFSLADSYDDAMVGTARDLSGTTNFTVDRLADEMEGVYVVSTGDTLDGSNGAWVRRNSLTLDIRWFGAVGDGVTDDRRSFMGAFECAATLGGSVHAPAGTWAFNGEIYVYRLTPLLTDGADVTTFKNLSATGRGLYFERHGPYGVASGALNTSFIAIQGGFTLDQNDSTGDGLTLRAQHTSVLGQIIIRDQGDGGFACNIDAATLIYVEFLSLVTCKRGLKLKDCYYPRIIKFAGEVTVGEVLDFENVISGQFDDLYIDPGSVANARNYLAKMVGCASVTILRLSGEADNSGAYGGGGLIHMSGCYGITILDGRLNVGANAYPVVVGKAIFELSGINHSFRLEKMMIQMGGGTGDIYLVRANATADNDIKTVSIKDVLMDLNNSGDKFLFYTSGFTLQKFVVSGCDDLGGATKIQYQGTKARIEDFDGDITNAFGSDTDGTSWTLINCPGTKTNLANATLVNS